MSDTKIPVVSFDAVKDRLDRSDEGANLLVGNGFSIACDPRYSYQALRQHAEGRLPRVSRGLLDRLETDNLEQVLQIVEDARWVAEHFESPDFDDELRGAHAKTCHSLVHALAVDHLKGPHQIDRDRARSAHAVAFLSLFERVFTTNYDLLLYWTMMKNAGHRDEGYNYRDGFRRAEGEPYGEFDPTVDVNVFYLHGALHLYEHRDEKGALHARKHVRTGNRGLVKIVQTTFDRGDSPLFVAGGRPEQKLETIGRSAYLRRCFREFATLEGPLVIFGWSLGSSDRHLLRALAENADLGPVFLSFYGEVDSPASLRLRATLGELCREAEALRGRPLEIALFESTGARVWG